MILCTMSHLGILNEKCPLRFLLKPNITEIPYRKAVKHIKEQISDCLFEFIEFKVCRFEEVLTNIRNNQNLFKMYFKLSRIMLYNMFETVQFVSQVTNMPQSLFIINIKVGHRGDISF